MASRSVLHYQLLEKVGAGGMGEVYKAQDGRLNRFVAIKLLRDTASGSPERRRRFFQEAQAASALNHPNIVTIHDIVSDGETDFIVMEYIAGRTLLDAIPNGGLRVPQALQYAIQMADALGAAHAAGIVHRDLKPGNVMVTESGRVKILDFGLAKLMNPDPVIQHDDTTVKFQGGAPLTTEGAVLGTVSYMSPEQAQGKVVNPQSDIFSFGAVLYEMLTSRRAFDGDSPVATLSAILRDEAKPIGEMAPDVPPQLQQVVNRCLRKDPDARWKSMKQVESELTALKQQSDSGQLYQPRIPEVKRRPAKLIAAVAVIAALTVAAAAWWWWARRASPQPAAALPAAVATAPPPSLPSDGALSNDNILDMIEAKAPVSVILSHIRSSKTNFNLSTSEVIRLVKAGVPANVIEAMRSPNAKQARDAIVNAPPAVSEPAQAKSIPEVAPPDVAPPAPPVLAQAASVVIADGAPFRIILAEDIPADAEAGRSLQLTVAENVLAGGSVVIARGAPVTGEIASKAGKKFLSKGKLTFRLLKVEGVDGKPLKVRATPADGPAGSSRPVDTKGSRSKTLAAARGAEYIGYIDGEQIVAVQR
jgi:serine/threonine protein kinase